MRIAALQSRGRWGARDFDKLIFELPIPRFDPQAAEHRQLVAAAREAALIAATVVLPTEAHFVRSRRLVRAALKAARLSVRLDRLVVDLLN